MSLRGSRQACQPKPRDVRAVHAVHLGVSRPHGWAADTESDRGWKKQALLSETLNLRNNSARGGYRLAGRSPVGPD